MPYDPCRVCIMVFSVPGCVDRRQPGTLNTIMHTRQGSYGTWNNGGYSNPKLDELVHRIEVEVDGSKRNAEIREALQMFKDDVGNISLHTQHSAWAVRDGTACVIPPTILLG